MHCTAIVVLAICLASATLIMSTVVWVDVIMMTGDAVDSNPREKYIDEVSREI